MTAAAKVDDDAMAAMDLEMQLLAPPHTQNTTSSTAAQYLHNAIRFIQSAIVFTEGINHAVSRVCSSKSIDNSPDQLHDHQTARIDIMEDVEDGDLSQTAPLLNTEDNTLVLRKQMRKLIYVLYSSQMFKASVPTAYEATEISKPVDERIDNKRESISKIVREKNLQDLHKEFGDLIRVADALDTDLINGISDTEAINRGRLQTAVSLCPNPIPPHTFFHFILESFKNTTIRLLSLAAVLSLGFGIEEEGLQNGWYDGVIVLITIILLVIFASSRKFWQQHKDRNKSEKNLQQFTNGRIVTKVHVKREGETKYICESELVSGDVILLKKGCQVPADGLFINGQALELDCESECCIIDNQNPFLSYGERVINGDATMVVTSINMNTRWSEMMSKATRDPKMKFKLVTHLDKLNTFLHYTGLIIGIIILFVLFFRHMAGKFDEENDTYKLESIAEPTAARNFANTFKKIVKESKNTTRALTKLLCVSLIGVTEGVPFVVSFAIFYWNHVALSGNKAIEQDSEVIAKMGLATRICCDFTENEMEVDTIFIGGEFISGCTTLSVNVVEALCDGFWTSTEKAVVDWAKEKFGLKRERMIQSSTSKMYENESVKEILNKCTHYFHTQGEKYSMEDDNVRSSFEQANEDMLHKKLKTIAFVDDDDDDFILVALVGLKNTPMEVIKTQVKEFRDCGIETVMVSSRKVSILKDIAIRCEVITEGDPESLAIIRGQDFRELGEDERFEKVDKIRVLGEAIPSDKLLFIETLRKKGEVVTFIGQRTDEAPILREADIGISIGTWSSIKARESSDIFICEYGSTFDDLINIIKSGKCIHHNIQRFIQLVLITAVSSTLINFYQTVAFGDALLTTVELVFVNLSVDFLGGFALLTTSSSSSNKVVPIRGLLITAEMIRNIILQVLYQVISSVILLEGFGMKTMVSRSFILSQFFNLFNARELQKKNFLKGIHHHKQFMVSIAIFIVLYGVLVMGEDTIGYGTRLNLKQWAVCVGVGVMTWLIDWLGKYISIMFIMVFIRALT